MEFGRGSEPSDPQSAEITLLLLAAGVGMPPGMQYGFLGRAEMRLASPLETAGQLEDILSSFARGNAALDSGHF